MFVYHAVKVYRLREGAEAEMACKKLFGFSTLWLFMVFALILLEHAVGVPAFAPVTG
jgi:protoheme IX farnesyltransferase